VAAAPSTVATLDAAGYRLTEPRRALAGLIGDRQGHFTADELVQDARRRGLRVARATVFRFLELMVGLGAVERLDLPSGEHAYVACAPDRHHHHIVCGRCGRTAEIPDLGLADIVHEAARRSGYEVTSHRLELFGTCPSCAARQARGAE
jgi:Fur family ferric uptake transcriptional regulator